MPVAPTYPGVYIEEIPSGVRTIVGVATSIAAFVDAFERGPLNRAVRVFNMGDVEREFGGLDRGSEASYALQQFFLNGGAEAWVVRVAGEDLAAAPPIAPAAAAVTVQDAPGGADLLAIRAGRRMRGLSVADPGTWGNRLRVDVDYAAEDPATQFNLTISEVEVQNGRPVVLRTETFRNLVLVAGARHDAIAVVNDGSKLGQLVLVGAAGARPAQTGTVGDALPDPVPVLANNDALNVNWNGAARLATLRFGTTPNTPRGLAAALQSALRAADPTVPLLAGATVNVVDGRLRVLAGRGGGFDPETILTFTEAGGTTADDLGLTGANVVANVQQYSLGTGAAGAQSNAVLGADGLLPGADALRGVRDPDKSGLYALEDVNLFNILCIPRAAELAENELAATLAEALAYCVERRAFLLVDPPPTIDTVQEAQDWLEANATLRHRNAAFYFPRVRIADPLDDYRLRSFAPSGTIAGLYARTDATRGVWKAPAGTEAMLRNARELDYKLTDPENGVLNPLAINCLRTFDVIGHVCWGARTLEGSDRQASEWKYVPVRRLALYIEESLYRGTQWVVFEPNDEPLWAQIRLNVGAFMHNLFRQGAFQGRTPREAYLVKCDGETTTQNDINLGIVNILVGFAPLKPAEFVIIKIQQLAGQVEV